LDIRTPASHAAVSSSATPRSVASRWIAFQASLLGRTWPFSHRLTVEKVTLSACASPSWVNPARRRQSRRRWPACDLLGTLAIAAEDALARESASRRKRSAGAAGSGRVPAELRKTLRACCSPSLPSPSPSPWFLYQKPHTAPFQPFAPTPRRGLAGPPPPPHGKGSAP